jgi:hypothetical protein
MSTTHESVTTVVFHGLGGRMFVALWGGLVVVLVSRAVGLNAWQSAAAVVVLVGACSLGLPGWSAVLVAVTGWLVVDGFVAHRQGQLGLDSRLVWALIATLATALIASTITRKATR